MSGLRPMRSDRPPVYELPEAPHGRVEGGEDADAADGEPGVGEEDREQPPGEAVVEVVDQPGLRARRQRPVPEGGEREDLPGGQVAWWRAFGGVVGGLVAGVAAGLAHEERGQAEAERGVGDAEEERLGAQPVLLGDVAGGEGGEGDGAVAGGFVEAHGEPAAGRADEVDLHDHGGRPGEALVDAEQHVGEHHPAPRRRPHQQQRDRQADEPAGDEHRLAAEAVGEGAGEEVGRRLDDAEGDDERQRGGERGEPELLVGEQRQDGAFLADHPADEGVDGDEQGELGEVLPQPEPQTGAVGGAGGAVIGRCARRRPVAVAQVSGPPSSTHRRRCDRGR